MKYHIEATTKGTTMPHVYPIDHPSPESLNDEEIRELMDYDDIPFTGGIPEEYEGIFKLKVTDEAGNLVYETDDISNHMFYERDCDFDDELEDVIEAHNNEENLDVYEQGYYVVALEQEKWNTCNYEVECDEFNPELLCYVPMAGFQCMGTDNWSDPYHLTYNKQYLQHGDDEMAEDFYGVTYTALYEKTQYGHWHMVKELEED